jgi:DNA-nicking Smr family endonuclease
MSKEGGRRPRGLSKDESELWEGVTRSVAPLKKRVRRPTDSEVNPADEPATPTAPRKVATVPQSSSSKLRPEPKAPPSLTPFDRKTRQKIARGKREIGGRLDLHGHTQDEAHAALLRFLRGAQAKGASVVLVITGKGARGPGGEQGVLKRAVPMWLRLPEFRDYVIGFDDAAIGHGGEGALYVRVRKPRS